MSRAEFRVALADDDAAVRRVVRSALEQMHGSVVEAVDGGGLRTLLVEQHFDLVVTDLRMPRWTGLAVLLEARARGDRTPAIVMTGEVAVLRGVVPPGNGVLLLEKPFLSVALRRAVATSLRLPVTEAARALPAAPRSA